MTHGEEPHQAKMSPEFRARLARLKPQQQVRAIIMLRPEGPGETPGQRQARGNRQAVFEAVRQATEAALSDIDAILAHYGGKRLATSVNALGSVPVETTAAGINALAASERVKVIFEDQKITLLAKPKHV